VDRAQGRLRAADGEGRIGDQREEGKVRGRAGSGIKGGRGRLERPLRVPERHQAAGGQRPVLRPGQRLEKGEGDPVRAPVEKDPCRLTPQRVGGPGEPAHPRRDKARLGGPAGPLEHLEHDPEELTGLLIRPVPRDHPFRELIGPGREVLIDPLGELTPERLREGPVVPARADQVTEHLRPVDIREEGDHLRRLRRRGRGYDHVGLNVLFMKGHLGAP